MTSNNIKRIKSITEYHRIKGLSKPAHPLISVIKYEDLKQSAENNSISWIYDFYSIALKKNILGKIKYGQLEYDFDEGILFFIAPGQLLKIEIEPDVTNLGTGLILLIHPDYLWNTSLAKTIRQYDFFGYAVNEALFLSDKEEIIIEGLISNINQEHNSNIDKYSQRVIVSQVEVLLNYADRFYNRQFITRTITNHTILNNLENVLEGYFNSDDLGAKGLPTVQYISKTLNISPNYLSGLLKALTGKSTQEHIQDRLIEKAKEVLSTTDFSVSEIAYQLGFEYSQSFSKLFKSKTNLSPLQFRSSFN
ncbi:helix-turn-helix domain-containing protein [Emticicia sp. SJ17W-69]|uniref:helix-turn-helix domain-containing protein n=1 Tax=Emticicia sp. SJ17W-69 TaxID=3421657 RepID=UPI003EBC35A6